MLSPTSKRIFQLALPTLIGYFLANVNTTIDSVMVGQASSEQLATLGVGMTLYLSLFLPCMGIILALIPLFAAANAKKDYQKVASLLKQGSWISLFLSAIIILIMAFPSGLLAITKTSEAFNQDVKQYLLAMSFGIPAILLAQVYFAFFTGMLKPKIIMMINLLTLGFKLALNAVLIYWVMPKASATASALATSLVTWIAILSSFLIIHKQEQFKSYSPLIKKAVFNLKAQWEVLKLGIPIGVNFSVDAFFFSAITLLIAQFGTDNIAANQIAGNLSFIAYLIPLAIGNVSTALIAEKLAAEGKKDARLLSTQTLKLSICTQLALSSLFVFFSTFFVYIYTKDAAVTPIAAKLVLLMGIYRIFDSFLVNVGCILRGYKKTIIPTAIYALTLWPIGFGLGYFLSFHSGITFFAGAAGFWSALIVSAGVGSLLNFFYYQSVSLPRTASPQKPSYAEEAKEEIALEEASETV